MNRCKTYLIEYCDCESELYLYADDAKVFKHINNEFNSQVLQDDLIKMKTMDGRMASTVKCL